MLLDIIFRFGEHYYQNEDEGNFWLTLFFTFLSAFLGFLFALWVDRLSNKKANKVKEKEELHQLYNQLRYFRDCLNAVLTYVPNQVGKFETFAQNLRDNPHEIVIPEIGATYDLLRLKEVDTRDNREAFFKFFNQTEDNLKMYRNSIAYADYLHRTFTQSEVNITRAIGFKHKDQLIVGDCLEDLSLRLGMRQQELLAQGHNNTPEFNLISELAEVHSNLISTFMNFGSARTQFIEPLFANALQIIQNEELAKEVFVVARKAHSKLRSIEANSNHVADEYASFGDNTSDAIEALNNLMNAIDEISKPD